MARQARVLVNPTQRNLESPRRYPVRSAERRQKVIQRRLVRQVQNAQLQICLEFLFMKEIVRANARVKQIPRRDAGRIVVRIIRARCRYHQPGRPIIAVAGRNRVGPCSVFITAIESDCRLLIACQCQRVCQVRYRARYFPRIEAPREHCPPAVFAALVPEERRLLQVLIVINAENARVQR